MVQSLVEPKFAIWGVARWGKQMRVSSYPFNIFFYLYNIIK